ncbi:hypothetical protein F5J12DRAFT_278158 [Pisolithus orientalis]|uniref:uncharacterized protein n=1 Tax=Pisolithus orientalis TaxID=936130 RepID=UPI0022245A7E|nr:uncharacterized protein F5J12DRAFT_278158 [Pisolithus orientalis]KAI5999414.1 hypothetical protein F5J12DRAFT_278158 [Pisolithus orientalis]
MVSLLLAFVSSVVLAIPLVFSNFIFFVYLISCCRVVGITVHTLFTRRSFLFSLIDRFRLSVLNVDAGYSRLRGERRKFRFLH